MRASVIDTERRAEKTQFGASRRARWFGLDS
jgi:hypothetical protein